MEDDQELKHMCKFCYKSFPCGRSLGGHMRSHLINIPFDHNHKTDQKLPKKKLPPLNNPKFGNFIEDGGQFGSEKAKKTSKLCKQCGKSFQSWKALFGHMKCHSVNGKSANSVEEGSWNSSNYDQKMNKDNQSDDESATLLCRKKRSESMKRYTVITNSSSFNIVPNFSPCVSEIDQQEEEEVALSLILLSRDDLSNSHVANSGFASSDNSSEFLHAKKNSKNFDKNSKNKSEKIEQFKSLATRDARRNRFNTSKQNEFIKKNPDIECDEYEVNLPRNLIKKRGFDRFESDFNKEKANKRKFIDSNDSTLSACKLTPDLDFDNRSKFTCTVCKKAFASYQALGGHRASHKKFNGRCAATTENSHENQIPPNQKLIKKCSSNENLIGVFAEKTVAKSRLEKNRDHECPICFRVFPSGQALGGHKRSHLIADQARITNPDVVIQKPKIPEIHEFLDLNLPAPDQAMVDLGQARSRVVTRPALQLMILRTYFQRKQHKKCTDSFILLKKSLK